MAGYIVITVALPQAYPLERLVLGARDLRPRELAAGLSWCKYAHALPRRMSASSRSQYDQTSKMMHGNDELPLLPDAPYRIICRRNTP